MGYQFTKGWALSVSMWNLQFNLFDSACIMQMSMFEDSTIFVSNSENVYDDGLFLFCPYTSCSILRPCHIVLRHMTWHCLPVSSQMQCLHLKITWLKASKQSKKYWRSVCTVCFTFCYYSIYCVACVKVANIVGLVLGLRLTTMSLISSCPSARYCMLWVLSSIPHLSVCHKLVLSKWLDAGSCKLQCTIAFCL